MENLNTLYVLKTIIKNRFRFLLIMFGAAVISFGASFLIKDKYKSEAVIYPVNLFPNSEESSSEQLLQYLLSEDVKYKLAKDFKLFEKYGIDTVNSKGGKALFNFMYLENFKISPTIYESVEITVKDEDPRLAQQLNIALINNTNLLIKTAKINVVQQYLSSTKKVIEMQAKELDSLSKTIVKIKSDYNILDEKDQAKYLSKQLSTGSSLNENSQLVAKGIKEKGTELQILDGRVKSTLKSYTKIKAKSDKYLMDVSGDMDFFIYVSKPNLQDKKCSPIRWIIVLVSSFSACFMALVFFLYKSRSKELI